MSKFDFLLLTTLCIFCISLKASLALCNGNAATKTHLAAYHEHRHTDLNYLRKNPTYEEKITGLGFLPCSMLHGISHKDIIVTANNLKFIDGPKTQYRFVTNIIYHPGWNGKYYHDACALVLERPFYGVLSCTPYAKELAVNENVTLLSYGADSSRVELAHQVPFSPVLLTHDGRSMVKAQCTADYEKAGLGYVPDHSNFCIPHITGPNDAGAPVLKYSSKYGLLFVGSVSYPGICGFSKNTRPGVIASSTLYHELITNIMIWDSKRKPKPYKPECHKCCRKGVAKYKTYDKCYGASPY